MSTGRLMPHVRAAAAILLLGVGLALTGAAPAGAAGVGYVRLAHLSPDTPNVDVYLSSQSAPGRAQVFPGVGYGTVSAYLPLTAGSYAVAMRAAGAPASAKPVLTTSVRVAPGHAYTVAGVGRHADLGLRVLDDDLSLPPAGLAKVRIVQASVRAPQLRVAISGGQVIAEAVAFATTTSYREVSPGRWNLRVGPSGGGTSTVTIPATLNTGNVYSLVVVDGARGLRGELKLDAARTGAVPNGGVETGGGGTAAGHAATGARTVLAMVGLLLGLLAALFVAAGGPRRTPRRAAP
jgi:hypothetical protein